jgi:putative photosynthetic complex assembly protein
MPAMSPARSASQPVERKEETMPVAIHPNPAPRRAFPRLPLYAAIGLVGFALIATVFSETTGIGTVRVDAGAPVDIRDLVFSKTENGSLAITDAESGKLIRMIPAGAGGFISGAIQGLGQTRKVKQIDPATPYRLIAWDDGQLTLSDTGTGERIVLNAFGPTNAGAFHELLDEKGS